MEIDLKAAAYYSFFRWSHLYLLPFEATSGCFSFPILTPLPQANKRLLAETFIILNVLDFFSLVRFHFVKHYK